MYCGSLLCVSQWLALKEKDRTLVHYKPKKLFNVQKNLIIFQKKYFIVSKFDHRLGPKFVDFIPI